MSQPTPRNSRAKSRTIQAIPRVKREGALSSAMSPKRWRAPIAASMGISVNATSREKARAKVTVSA